MENKNENVFDETVKSLIDDAKSLNGQLSKAIQSEDHRKYIDVLRALKDTMNLIKEYDWQLMYTEYDTEGRHEVTVWEQNHDCQVRNHKIWNVGDDKITMYIDYDVLDITTIYVNGERYSASYETLSGNHCISLVHLIKSFKNKVDVYIDKRGCGLMISDILESNGIKCNDIKNHKVLIK